MSKPINPTSEATMQSTAKTAEAAKETNVMEMIWQAVNTGSSLADIQGVPKETMEGLYACAYDMYNKGQLDEAETFFRFLCIYDFHNADYIMGLAAVHQLKKNYQKACDLYGVAFALDSLNLQPLFYTGQCQLLLGNNAVAKECFKMVAEDSNNSELRNKASAWLHSLETANTAESNETTTEGKSS